jgi:hypothetical protein
MRGLWQAKHRSPLPELRGHRMDTRLQPKIKGLEANMKNMRNILLWTIGLLMAAVATWQFYLFAAFRDSNGFLETQGGTLHLWLGIAAAVAACLCAFLGIFRRINHTEELHITS